MEDPEKIRIDIEPCWFWPVLGFEMSGGGKKSVDKRISVEPDSGKE